MIDYTFISLYFTDITYNCIFTLYFRVYFVFNKISYVNITIFNIQTVLSYEKCCVLYQSIGTCHKGYHISCIIDVISVLLIYKLRIKSIGLRTRFNKITVAREARLIYALWLVAASTNKIYTSTSCMQVIPQT